LTNKTRVYISGANGNLGGEILNRLKSRTSIEVIKLKRDSNNSYLSDLAQLHRSSQDNEDVFIHCGWDVLNRDINNQRICFADTEKLAQFCLNQNVRMIFISSTSASGSSKSNYGVMKFCAEQAVARNFGFVLRPGLVLFPKPKGIQRQANLFKESRIKLRFNPDVHIYAIDLEKFVEEVEDSIQKQTKSDVIDCLGNKLTTLNTLFGTTKTKSKYTFVIPIKLASVVLGFCGRFSRKIGNMHDSLMGVM